MRRGLAVAAVLAYALAGAALAGSSLDADSAPMDPRSGGDATTFDSTRVAFTQHVPSTTPDQLLAFAFGNRIFSTPWVEAPASVEQFDGLGPFYSARSCSGCHVRDGRGPCGLDARDRGEAGRGAR